MNRVRTFLGPTGLDIRTTTVVQRVRTWTGGDDGSEVGLGTPTDSDTTISPRPKVRELSDTEIEVGPITPSHSTGGYTVAQLNPTLVAGQQCYWIIGGPAGDKTFQLTEIDTTKPLRYMLRMKAITRPVPF